MSYKQFVKNERKNIFAVVIKLGRQNNLNIMMIDRIHFGYCDIMTENV